VSNQSFLKHFDIKAAIVFIAAHFITLLFYYLIIVDDTFSIWQGGFILHISQSLIYLVIPFINISVKLRIASFAISIFYGLIAINWLLLERGIETNIQAYFYDSFASIITTMNLIVIYLLGKDGAIHLLNMFFSRIAFLNKLQLFFRDAYYSCICSVYLSFSYKNIESKESGE
tara:strand:- start:839 stop:1357 length:519 start_codon:yes stop_codon:yes gene_type:complete